MTQNLVMKDTILLLGSGALKIGEAGEFDYSGSQAIKALREEGKRIVLVNPNVATIQTSEGLADEVYFLPVTAQFVTKVIEKETPTGILLSFGGQTALNCGLALEKQGILKKYGVEVLGTPTSAIEATEDREIFAKRMEQIGLSVAGGSIVKSVEEGLVVAKSLGYPVMLRAGFALGGSGSGIAKSEDVLRTLLENAFATTTQVIVEECLYGWKELEYEVVRDKDDNCIVVCTMENFDPVGIHTGESIVVAPAQTLTNEEFYRLRSFAIAAIRELKIVGECNIQFALDPVSDAVRVIEVNARLSRSSALASKATGYPLAYVATKLTLGKTLPELRNLVTGETSAFFEPALDYMVVKMPRWDLDKFEQVHPSIGSEMKSVGEVMSIGRSFAECIQNAARMLNDGYVGVVDPKYTGGTKIELLKRLETADTLRLFTICSALFVGISKEVIHEKTKIDLWFISHLVTIVECYKNLFSQKILTYELMLAAKQLGFSDKQIGDCVGTSELDVRLLRTRLHVVPVVKRIDTMAGEFPAKTNYLYMTYEGSVSDYVPRRENKVIVLGCGPYAIGTSVEFDWCAVNTVQAIRDSGRKAVVINCNPETVSTDYDMSDYLYFEALSFERVMDIYDLEQSPVVVSVGGQIPNNLAPKLSAAHVPILGTSSADIYRAEHRKEFSGLLDDLGVRQPAWAEAKSADEARAIVGQMMLPVLVRPSFVLSGKGMQVIDAKEDLEEYLKNVRLDMSEHPLAITEFLVGARECDVDGVAADGSVLVHAISGHIEGGGVHSGDSTLVYPAAFLRDSEKADIMVAVEKIVQALNVSGPFNIQFLLTDDTLSVIECNLRASRSVPFVSKISGVNFMHVATKVLLGISDCKPIDAIPMFTGVKVPQFSFHKLRGADPITGVEMHSTGEVVGLGSNPYEAYIKGILATGYPYPGQTKAALFSLGGRDGKLTHLSSVQAVYKAGYKIFATTDTSLFLREHGVETTTVGKVYEGVHPNVGDLLGSKMVDFAVIIPEKRHTVTKARFAHQVNDGYMLRRMAVDKGIPLFANSDHALFFIQSMLKYTPDTVQIKAWSEYRENGKR